VEARANEGDSNTNVYGVASSRRNVPMDPGRPLTPPESQASTSAALPPPTMPETNIYTRTRPPDVPSTPPKPKTHSVPGRSSSLSLNTMDQKNGTFWANLLWENGRICRNIKCFLTGFVPCVVPVPLDLSWDLFADYTSDGKMSRVSDRDHTTQDSGGIG
jgi:hypothetical protein